MGRGEKRCWCSMATAQPTSITFTDRLVSLMPRGVVLNPDRVILGTKGWYQGTSDPTARSRVKMTSKPASTRARRTWVGQQHKYGNAHVNQTRLHSREERKEGREAWADSCPHREGHLGVAAT